MTYPAINTEAEAIDATRQLIKYFIRLQGQRVLNFNPQDIKALAKEFVIKNNPIPSTAFIAKH
jgi:hypothetical protein